MDPWEEQHDSEEYFSADHYADIDKYFSDIYTSDQIFSNHQVEVPETDLSQDYRGSSSSEGYQRVPGFEYERHFHMKHSNRRTSITRYSTCSRKFMYNLLDIDVVYEGTRIYPYGYICVLESTTELEESTKQLRKEALANLKFSLLTKSYSLTTTLVEKVVERYVSKLLAEVRDVYMQKIHETTMNLFYAIVCDTFDDNMDMQQDIEVEEQQFRGTVFTHMGDSSSQVEHDVSTKQRIEIETASSIGEHAAEETMETFYQHFMIIDDKKTLRTLIETNFMETDDITIAKTIYSDTPTWQNEFRVRQLTLCGMIWKENPTRHSRQRTLLFLLSRMRIYRRMTVVFWIHAPKYGFDEREARKTKGWRFTLRISTYCKNTSHNEEDKSSQVIRIFFARKKRLKKLTKPRK